jgi:hypothetical protein
MAKQGLYCAYWINIYAMWIEAEIRRVILDHAQAHTAISSRSAPHARRTDVKCAVGLSQRDTAQ